MSSQRVDLVFSDAGYGTVALGAPAPPLPAVQLIAGSDGPTVHVQNLSPYEFEAFGAVTGVSVAIGPGSLAPGREASFAASDQICPICSAAEAVAGRGGLWDDSRWWQVYEPLASAAGGLVGDEYFFGFVENMPLTIRVNGDQRTFNGPGMLVVEMEGFDLGYASPTIVATSPESSIQGEGPWRWLSGEWALMQFTVPTDREITLEFDPDMFGLAPSMFEAWDWTTGDFDSVETGKIEADRFVGPDGVVLLRINLGAAENEFFGEFPLGPVSLTWDVG